MRDGERFHARLGQGSNRCLDRVPEIIGRVCPARRLRVSAPNWKPTVGGAVAAIEGVEAALQRRYDHHVAGIAGSEAGRNVLDPQGLRIDPVWWGCTWAPR